MRVLGYNKKDTIMKAELWNRLSFVLSLNGCLISPNIVNSHRELNNNRIVTITDGNKRIIYEADEIVHFDKKDDENIKMLDWFSVRSGNNHQHEVIEDTNNRFINKLHFYRSQRVGGNSNIKDVLAVSDFNTKESFLVDHSEGIARLKVLQMMKEAGIRGQSNGYDKDGRRLHYAINIEHPDRS